LVCGIGTSSGREPAGPPHIGCSVAGEKALGTPHWRPARAEPCVARPTALHRATAPPPAWRWPGQSTPGRASPRTVTQRPACPSDESASCRPIASPQSVTHRAGRALRPTSARAMRSEQALRRSGEGSVWQSDPSRRGAAVTGLQARPGRSLPVRGSSRN